jgi:hypothetical protein
VTTWSVPIIPACANGDHAISTINKRQIVFAQADFMCAPKRGLIRNVVDDPPARPVYGSA